MGGESIEAMIKTCEGCGQIFKAKGTVQRFCRVACVPAESRRIGGRKAAKQSQYNLRMRRYRAEILRLQALPRITTEDLLASFYAVEYRGYRTGWQAHGRGRHKSWERRGAA